MSQAPKSSATVARLEMMSMSDFLLSPFKKP